MTQLTHKTIDATPVISLTITSTLNTLMEDIAQHPDEMMKECEAQSIEVLGPFIFEYRGACGEPDTEFELEMALPVKKGLDYQGKYQYKDMPSLVCVESQFTGPISEIESKGYNPMMQAMQEQGLTIKDHCREVYTCWEGPESEKNIIELQMAI